MKLREYKKIIKDTTNKYVQETDILRKEFQSTLDEISQKLWNKEIKIAKKELLMYL